MERDRRTESAENHFQTPVSGLAFYVLAETTKQRRQMSLTNELAMMLPAGSIMANASNVNSPTRKTHFVLYSSEYCLL